MKKYIAFIIIIFVFTKNIAQNINIDSCLHVLKSGKEDTSKVILLNKIAWDIAYKNLNQGYFYATQSYQLAKKLKFERLYARICNTKGLICLDLAEVPEALLLFQEGLKFAQKYSQYHALAALNNSLGNLYSIRSESRKALRHYILSASYLQKSEPDQIPTAAYSNVIGAYTNLRNLDSAKYYANICLTYNLKNKKTIWIANNYISLSDIYFSLENGSKCLDAAQNAVKYARQLGDEYTMSHAYLQLGNAFLLNNEYAKAVVALNQARFFADITGDIAVKEVSAEYLSRVYENAGDFKNSLKYFRESALLKDSALNMESIKQIKNSEAKFENEKKQKEIELLGEKQKVNEAENQQRKIYLYVSFIGITALAFLILILYRNNVLKQKTNNSLAAFNNEINKQKNLVEEKNKEITDSINYARRIQQSILTSDEYFKAHTKDYFIFFKPKDIVSGDFYWALNNQNNFILMTADCTGHGVPGAMMSMMGINFLNEIVNERKTYRPAEILNQLRHDIIKALNPVGSTIETKDGMDCCLCSFDLSNKKLTYANANNNFYLLRKGILITSETNKMPVGAGHSGLQLFSEQELNLQTDDLIICLTDGYADQFGGAKGKKFKYKQLEEILIKCNDMPLIEIKNELVLRFDNWKGNLEQVDDVCIIGIRV